MHGVLMGIFDRFKQVPREDFVELDTSSPESKLKNMYVEVEKLETLGDSDRIQEKVRLGDRILIVRVDDLKNRDANELRRAVSRVKRTCRAINGDIAGLGENWIIVTGSSARVHRENTN